MAGIAILKTAFSVTKKSRTLPIMPANKDIEHMRKVDMTILFKVIRYPDWMDKI